MKLFSFLFKKDQYDSFNILIPDYTYGDICINTKALKVETGIFLNMLKEEMILKTVHTGDFLNIFLSDAGYLSALENWNMHSITDNINIEFVSANPTGPLHMGNMRSAFYGKVLAGILKMLNAKVCLEYYVNDRGNQIDELYEALNGSSSLYPKSVSMLKQHNTSLFLSEKSKIVSFFLETIDKQLSFFNVFVDVWTKESDIENMYMKDEKFWNVVPFCLDEKERKYVVSGSNDRRRYLFKENGEATYLLRDMMYIYHKRKYYDKAVMVVGSDHHEYSMFLRFFAASLSFDLTIKETGIISIQGSKLSKRHGDALSIEEFDESAQNALKWMFIEQKCSSNINVKVDSIDLYAKKVQKITKHTTKCRNTLPCKTIALTSNAKRCIMDLYKLSINIEHFLNTMEVSNITSFYVSFLQNVASLYEANVSNATDVNDVTIDATKILDVMQKLNSVFDI